jgi:hypothetical protein
MPGNPKTTEDAIWDIHARVVSLETTIRGTPNTKEGGLVGEVQEIKALSVEVKNANIEHAKAISWLQARCRAFHNGSGGLTDPDGETGGRQNPLKKVPKGRLFGFLGTGAIFVALVIYNLGGLCGWWAVK